jgi:hypothetical protein
VLRVRDQTGEADVEIGGWTRIGESPAPNTFVTVSGILSQRDGDGQDPCWFDGYRLRPRGPGDIEYPSGTGVDEPQPGRGFDGADGGRSWLAPPAPNPARRGTPCEVRFGLAESGRASLRIFDVGGRLVRTLMDANVAAGAGRLVWDGRGEMGRALPAGVYLLRLDAGRAVERRAAVLLD